jgi:hypothetical protein
MLWVRVHINDIDALIKFVIIFNDPVFVISVFNHIGESVIGMAFFHLDKFLARPDFITIMID